MILKIMLDFKKDEYWLIDSICNLTRLGIDLKSKAEGPDMQIYDLVLFRVPQEDQFSKVSYKVTNNNDVRYLLATDCIIYVLNDNGKTIQKILPKY